MSQRFMIDTNTVSYIVKGDSPASRAKLAGLQYDEIACISAITEAELQNGVAKSPNVKTLRPALEVFLAKIQILPWGETRPKPMGGFERNRRGAAKPLGNLVMLIAAHAVSAGAILVTNDKAFSHVPDLSAILNWATDR